MIGKEELVDKIEELQAEQEDVVKLGTGEADERKCAYCGEDMPYAKYNQQAPSQPYVIWMMPGEDDHTPPAKKLYCTPGHLIKDIGLPFHFEPGEDAEKGGTQ